MTNASTSAAVSGATVSLGSAGSTTTNTSGVYTISNVPAGTYTATVSKTGFNNTSGSVSITAGSTTTKNFTLTPSDTQAPTVPTGLSANATGPTTVALTWTASTDNVGVTGYDIRRDGTTIGSSTGASYTDNSATANTTHSYEVRAKDAMLNYSAWCTAVNVTTPPTPPSATVVFSDGFNGNLNNWTQQVAGFAYSTDANRGGLTGAGAAFVAAGEADQMYKTFTRPFAQGVVSGYFWDGNGGWKAGTCGWAYRQALSVREPGGTAGFILDNCFASNVGNPDYYYRYLCCGWAHLHLARGTRCRHRLQRYLGTLRDHDHAGGPWGQPRRQYHPEGPRPSRGQAGHAVSGPRLLQLGHRQDHPGPRGHLGERRLLGRHHLHRHAAGRSGDGFADRPGRRPDPVELLACG